MEKIIQVSEIPIHGVIRLRYDGETFDHNAIDFPIVRTTFVFSDGEIEVCYFNSFDHKCSDKICREHEDRKFFRKFLKTVSSDFDCDELFDCFDDELFDILKEGYKDPIVNFDDFFVRLVNMCKFNNIWIDERPSSYFNELTVRVI